MHLRVSFNHISYNGYSVVVIPETSQLLVGWPDGTLLFALNEVEGSLALPQKAWSMLGLHGCGGELQCFLAAVEPWLVARFAILTKESATPAKRHALNGALLPVFHALDASQFIAW
jgi:hypothetical protein